MSTRESTDTIVRVVLLVLAVLVLLPLLLMTFAMPMMGMMGWWGGMGPGTGTSISPLWGLGSMLAVLLIVLGVGYYLTRSLAGASGDAPDPALEELRLAYARGDLSEEEFERRRTRLSRSEQE